MEGFKLAIKHCGPVVALITAVYNSLILVTEAYITTRAVGITAYLGARKYKIQKYFSNIANDYLSRSL